MKKCFVSAFVLMFLSMLPIPALGQSDFKDKRAEWLRKAEEFKPVLHETVCRPLSLVQAVEDASAFQGWRMEKLGEVSEYYGSSINEMPDVMVDFGRHMTGYFTFRMKIAEGVQDAPVRLKFTFGEVPAEMVTPFDPFPGSLSRAWMQDEILTLETIGEEVSIRSTATATHGAVHLYISYIHIRKYSRNKASAGI